MIIAELIGLVVLIATGAGIQYNAARFFKARLTEQDAAEEARRLAMYKQQKATSTAVAQSDRAVRKMVDQTRSLHDDTRLLQRRVDNYFAHPAMKKLTGLEDENRG